MVGGKEVGVDFVVLLCIYLDFDCFVEVMVFVLEYIRVWSSLVSVIEFSYFYIKY